MALYSPVKNSDTPEAAESLPVGPEATHIQTVIYNAGSRIAETGSQNQWLFPCRNEPHLRSLVGSSVFHRRLVGRGFAITCERLLALLQEQDEDEPKPTPLAARHALLLISESGQILRFNFPKAVVSADEEGGIRFRWRASIPEHEVRLYCPPTSNEKVYIYHEAGSEYGSEDNVSGQVLASWLVWLMGKENK